MGRQRKLAVAAAGSAFALGALRKARRRARAAAAARGFVEDVMPAALEEVPKVVPPPRLDDAHAAGHRHLPIGGWVTDEPEPPRVRSRPFAKRRHGLRHPGRG